MTTKLEKDLKALLEGKQTEEQSLLEAIKKKMEDEEPVAAETPTATAPEAEAEAEEPPVSIENPIDPTLIPQEPTEAPAEPEVETKEDEDEDKKEVKEDTIDSVLSEEFNEEFKTKATALFEAALEEKLVDARKVIEEEFHKKEQLLIEEFEAKTKDQTAIFEERIAEMENVLSEKIDGCLSQVAEQWMTDNIVAVDSGIKTDIAESFIMGIKGVFEAHSIDLPEAGVKLVSELQEDKTELSDKLSSLQQKLDEANEMLAEMKREKIIEETVKDFTVIDKAKFKTLIEGFVFESEREFVKKLDSIKESFFSKESKRNSITEEFAKKSVTITESHETEDDVSPRMQSYLRAL
jgi:hypothetical protein